ncbi:MAG: tyrosine-type recombinase/integrase, partial [Eubacteriales bacterium]
MAIYVICKEENKKVLFVSFEYTAERVSKIKTITGRRWDAVNKQWTIPYTRETVNKLCEVFYSEQLYIDPKIYRELNLDSELELETESNVLKFMHRELVLKGFSTNTCRSYLNHIRRFLFFIKKDPENIVDNDIKSFFVFLLQNKKCSYSYANQAISSVKFFCRYTLKKDILLNVPRPKKEKKLPDILSKGEVAMIFNSTKNVKHKAILMLTYSAGLRVSEVASLKVNDIDNKRMLIHIRQGKGRKDRYTLLSNTTLEVLREYAAIYRVKDWLFPGEKVGEHISERTIQKVFKNGCAKALIKKQVSVHSLRHS